GRNAGRLRVSQWVCCRAGERRWRGRYRDDRGLRADDDVRCGFGPGKQGGGLTPGYHDERPICSADDAPATDELANRKHIERCVRNQRMADRGNSEVALPDRVRDRGKRRCRCRRKDGGIAERGSATGARAYVAGAARRSLRTEGTLGDARRGCLQPCPGEGRIEDAARGVDAADKDGTRMDER